MAYRQLTESTVAGYLAGLPEMQGRFSSFDRLEVREVGDGNLNYVFVVRNADDPRQSAVVKQAVPFLRIAGESWPLSRHRIDRETAALRHHGQLCPEHAPEIFHASSDMSLLVMRNLDRHRIVRGALNDGVRFPLFADHMSTFLARTLFHSSDFFLGSEGKKAAAREAMNVELCRITEDFVFTHPYDGSATNSPNPALPQPAIDGIQRDPALRAAVAELKYLFMTGAEALLHGDLHTGSIMANQDETIVIDPEFAFYGPMGFDVGAMLANLWLAYFAHGYRQPALGHPPAPFREWLLATAEAVWSGFAAKFLALWREHDMARDGESFVGRDLDEGASAEAFRQRFMAKLLGDALGFAGCKMMRRIVGIAKVSDIAGIADPVARAVVEQQALAMGRGLVLGRGGLKSIGAVTALARTIAPAEAIVR